MDLFVVIFYLFFSPCYFASQNIRTNEVARVFLFPAASRASAQPGQLVRSAIRAAVPQREKRDEVEG